MEGLTYNYSETLAGLELFNILEILAGIGLASLRIGSFFLASP